MTTTAAPSHQSHSITPNDLELLDLISSLPTRSSAASPSTSYGSLHGDGPAKKRPLATLQALRRPPIDPIVLAASLSSGPHVTRHHFHHSFGGKVGSKQMRRSEREEQQKQEEQDALRRAQKPPARHRAGSYANCDVEGEHEEATRDLHEAVYSQMARPSKQMPRSERLRLEKEAKEQAERTKAAHDRAEREKEQAHDKQAGKALERPKLSREPTAQIEEELHQRKEALRSRQASSNAQNASLVETGGATGANLHDAGALSTPAAMPSIVRPPPLHVRCYARTRIPTPHGEILCHLYRNNRDSKEHLAFVVDPSQNEVGGNWERDAEVSSRHIRSKTLDEVWGPQETEMERIVRGAYVGRLGPTFQKASEPQARQKASSPGPGEAEPPLVRIHSECFTGETIGSQRCDCGEQLDEAIRLIHVTSPTRGVVVYLRQEGRGIGLLDKLMAYNLQDMGHDTVSANILLGHLADARRYDIAAEILRDLGVNDCKLLTNNPEKMESLEREGVHVRSRVAMVPRAWRVGHHHGRSRRRTKGKRSKLPSSNLASSVMSQLSNHHSDGEGNHEGEVSDDGSDSDSSRDSYVDHIMRRSGATMLGGSVTRGPELEKYLRTKVERMGHMLDLPSAASPAEAEGQLKGEPKTILHAADSGQEDEESASLMGESELRQFTTDDHHTADEGDEDEILIHHHHHPHHH